MNDTKTSSDESPECDSDPNTVVANMTPEDRAEYLAWVAECAAANLAHQMEHDGPDPAECGCATPTDSERTEAETKGINDAWEAWCAEQARKVGQSK